MDRSAEFRRWKAQCLSRADLSRKGSVDEDAVEIVQLLNAQEQFFTTSSCAGRILLLDGSMEDSSFMDSFFRSIMDGSFAGLPRKIWSNLQEGNKRKNKTGDDLHKGILDKGINGFEVQKKQCCWLLVTHKPCVKEDMIVALRKANGNAILKFEPFVLHVQCRQLRDAQILHSVAIDSGFRNSGITVGKRGKTILAVRSTHGLEVPLSHNGKLMVTEEYVDFLLNIANQKMEENKKRIERFYSCLQHALKRETITNSQTEIKDPSDTHKKKRNQEKSDYKCITEDCDKELENDDADDPAINVTIFPEDY